MFVEGYIGIAGLCGVGKSSLALKLAKPMGYAPLFDNMQNNPYLDRFYKDMGKHALELEFWLLKRRFQDYQKLVAKIQQGNVEGVVQSHTIWEDSVYVSRLHAAKLLADEQHSKYQAAFNKLKPKLGLPELLIFLDCQAETALRRIARAGVTVERGIKVDYLKSLQEHYYDFIEQMEDAGVRVLRLNWENIQPTSEIVRLVHEYRLKPAPLTTLLRPTLGHTGAVASLIEEPEVEGPDRDSVSDLDMPGTDTLIFLEDKREDTTEAFRGVGIPVARGLSGTGEVKQFVNVLSDDAVLKKACFIVDGDKGLSDLAPYVKAEPRIMEGIRLFRYAKGIGILVLPEGMSVEDLYAEYEPFLDTVVGKLYTTSFDLEKVIPADYTRTFGGLRGKEKPKSLSEAKKLIKKTQDVKDQFWKEISRRQLRMDKIYVDAMARLISEF